VHESTNGHPNVPTHPLTHGRTDLSTNHRPDSEPHKLPLGEPELFTDIFTLVCTDTSTKQLTNSVADVDPNNGSDQLSDQHPHQRSIC
jgi:hypothetical protein